MKQIVLSIVILVITVSATVAQDKRTVAIMPFMYSKENEAAAKQVQEMVVTLLSSRSDIHVVDRSKDSVVIAELGHSIRDVSVYAKEIKLGNITTAPEIIVGFISNASAEPVTSSGNILTGQKLKYSGILSFSLQLIELETGIIKQHETFTGKTKEGDAANKATQVVNRLFKSNDKVSSLSDATGSAVMADTKEQAVQTAIGNSEKSVLRWINKEFSTNIKIVSIQDRDNNLPQTVLVTGLGNNIKVGTELTINEINYFDVPGGTRAKQVKKIGELKVKELQGDITLCKVTEGKTALEEKMKGNNLELTVSN